jgi:hypothetical protein
MAAKPNEFISGDLVCLDPDYGSNTNDQSALKDFGFIFNEVYLVEYCAPGRMIKLKGRATKLSNLRFIHAGKVAPIDLGYENKRDNEIAADFMFGR